MAKSRKFLTAGAVGVAAIALIGAGAGATFQDSVTGTQTITAGTLSMMMTSDSGTVTNSGKTWTLTADPVNSHFTTGVQHVTITNNGTVDATMTSVNVANTGDATLLGEVKVDMLAHLAGGSTYQMSQTLASPAAFDIPVSGQVFKPHESAVIDISFSNAESAGLDNTVMGKTVSSAFTVNFEN